MPLAILYWCRKFQRRQAVEAPVVGCTVTMEYIVVLLLFYTVLCIPETMGGCLGSTLYHRHAGGNIVQKFSPLHNIKDRIETSGPTGKTAGYLARETLLFPHSQNCNIDPSMLRIQDNFARGQSFVKSLGHLRLKIG